MGCTCGLITQYARSHIECDRASQVLYQESARCGTWEVRALSADRMPEVERQNLQTGSGRMRYTECHVFAKIGVVTSRNWVPRAESLNCGQRLPIDTKHSSRKKGSFRRVPGKPRRSLSLCERLLVTGIELIDNLPFLPTPPPLLKKIQASGMLAAHLGSSMPMSIKLTCPLPVANGDIYNGCVLQSVTDCKDGFDLRVKSASSQEMQAQEIRQ